MHSRLSSCSPSFQLSDFHWRCCSLRSRSHARGARSAQCKENLKNLGFGAIHHEVAHGSFPSGGWGWDWVGDPDRGFLETQPGGWVYNVLPFIEQKDTWALGKGIDFATQGVEKKQALAKQLIAPVPLLYCPSRRGAHDYPYTAPEPDQQLRFAA